MPAPRFGFPTAAERRAATAMTKKGIPLPQARAAVQDEKKGEAALKAVGETRNAALQKRFQERRKATDNDAPTDAPNGAVGIPYREDKIHLLLRSFAKSDFKHDFGEKVPARDLITYADRGRFAEMVQKFAVKERVTMLNKFDGMFKGVGKSANLLGLLQKGISAQLYPDPRSSPDPPPPSEFVSEDDILKKIGLDYVALKDLVKASPPTPTVPFKIDTFPIKPEGGLLSRNYRVGAQYYKNAEDGTTRNLASLFKDATGGATKFALLIDASLGMSVTQAGDSTLTPDPGAVCDFVILQNVESDADSATGATDFKMKPGGANPSRVKIMRDFGTSTVLYPIWNAGDKRTEAENLFSKIQILLNRVEAGDIEASILFGTESHTIPDVGTTSNVKNASLNGLAALFVNEMLGAAATMGDRRKPYLYALLKRMGDWCQALSLLDRIRTYKEMNPKTKKERIPVGAEQVKVATLQDLITDGYEVGLVTNDRILLAYALLLGLNVYFTTASDLNCLLYFKNLDDVAGGADLVVRAKNNYENFIALLYGVNPTGAIPLPALKESVASKIIAAKNTYLPAIPDDESAVGPGGMAEDTPYQTFNTRLLNTIMANLGLTGGDYPVLLASIAMAFRVKVILSNLGELRVNFDEIESEMKKSIDEYDAAAVTGPTADAAAKKMFGASVSLVNLANRLNTDIQHNTDVFARLEAGIFPEKTFTSQQNVFADLAMKIVSGMRISTSEIMKRAKDVLLSSQDDIKQVLQKPLMPPDLLLKYIPVLPTPAVPSAGVPRPRPNDKDIANLATLYGAFDALRAGIPVGGAGRGQRGGANAELLKAVKQREIFPYKSAKLETTVNKLTNRAKLLVEARARADEAAAAAEAAGEELSSASAVVTAAAAAEKAYRDLELLESLPVVRVGTYYRDEKSRPYSVADRYLITKEDSKVLEQLLEGLVTAGTDPASNFIFYRSALLYHDILYERLEHVYDQSLVSNARPDHTVEVEDFEETDGSLNEFSNLVKESITLRKYVNRYSFASRSTRTTGMTPAVAAGVRAAAASGILQLFRGEMPAAVLPGTGDKTIESTGTPLNNTIEERRRAISKTLSSIRTTIIGDDDFRGAYRAPEDAPSAVDPFVPADTPEDAPGAVDPFDPADTPEAEIPANTVEAIIDDSAGAPPDDNSALKEEEWTAILVDDGAPAPLSRPGWGTPAAGDGSQMRLEGGSRLHSAGSVESNAGGTRNDSSRRRLYEGLRKRGGAGSTPEL